MEAGLIKEKYEGCVECDTHPKGYQVVISDMQYLIDRCVLQISCTQSEEDVVVIEPHFKLPTHVEIPYQRVNGVPPKVNHVSAMIVCMPSPFPFESTNVIPW